MANIHFGRDAKITYSGGTASITDFRIYTSSDCVPKYGHATIASSFDAPSEPAESPKPKAKSMRKANRRIRLPQ